MNTWDVGRVTDMSKLFYVPRGELRAPQLKFNENIGAWDTLAAGWGSTASSTSVERFLTSVHVGASGWICPSALYFPWLLIYAWY